MPVLERSQRRAAWPGFRIGSNPTFLPGPALLFSVSIALFLGLMLLVVVYLSFYKGLPGVGGTLTLNNYTALFGDRFLRIVIVNTLVYASVAVLVSLLFGVLIAWLVERTDLPGRNIVYTAMTAGLLVPAFFPAMGWLFLLHPRIGFVNVWAKQLLSESAVFNIATPVGMGWVEGITLAPVVFIMVAANLRMADTTLEEAAKVAGANSWQLFKGVILPLSTPATLAAALYVAAIAVASFDIPAIIGLSNRVYTLGTFIYEDLVPHQGFPEYGRPAAVSTFLILIGVLLSFWYIRTIRQANRFQLITGKSYRPLRYPLGRWRFLAAGFVIAYFCMQMLVPVGLLVWVSLQPYVQPPSFEALSQLTLANFVNVPWRTAMTGLENSAILMVAVPVLSLIVCFIYSWVVLRSRTRLRYVLDAVAFLPHAVPAIVFAVSGLLLALFVFRQIVPLYGTLTLLLGVHVMNRISFGTRVTNSALIAVSEELEEAAEVCGGSKSNIVRKILLPLVSPALINAFFWISLLTLRELTLATILYSPRNITLSVVIWSLWNSGEHGPSAAVSLLMMIIMVPVMLVGWRAGHYMTDALTGMRRA